LKRYATFILFFICIFLIFPIDVVAQTTTDTSDLEDIFVYDEDFRTTAIDPDVIVLCPMYGRDSTLSNSGKSMQEEASKLSAVLGGRNVYKKGATAITSLLNTDLTEFGTVLMTTHGAKFSRYDNSTVVGLGIYRQNNKKTAEMLWESIKRSGNVDPERCVNCIETNLSLTKAIEQNPTPHFLFHEVKGLFGIGTYYEVVFTTDWFMWRYSNARFPNTLFFINACESHGDSAFQSFLIEHGASLYLGHKDDISIPVQGVANSTHAFMEHWTEVDESYQDSYAWRYKTINDANRAILNTVYCNQTTADINFTYMGMGRLHGKVVDGARNEALSDVRVHAWRYWDGKLEKWDTRTTKEDGSYLFEGLPWGMYLLQAEDGITEGFLNISLADKKTEAAEIILEQEGMEETYESEEDQPHHNELSIRGVDSLDEYLGEWIMEGEEFSGLRLIKNTDGNYELDVSFYRIALFEATYEETDEDGWLVFQSEYDDILRLALYQNRMLLIVQPDSSYIREVYNFNREFNCFPSPTPLVCF